MGGVGLWRQQVHSLLVADGRGMFVFFPELVSGQSLLDVHGEFSGGGGADVDVVHAQRSPIGSRRQHHALPVVPSHGRRLVAQHLLHHLRLFLDLVQFLLKRLVRLYVNHGHILPLELLYLGHQVSHLHLVFLVHGLHLVVLLQLRPGLALLQLGVVLLSVQELLAQALELVPGLLRLGARLLQRVGGVVQLRRQVSVALPLMAHGSLQGSHSFLYGGDVLRPGQHLHPKLLLLPQHAFLLPLQPAHHRKVRRLFVREGAVLCGVVVAVDAQRQLIADAREDVREGTAQLAQLGQHLHAHGGAHSLWLVGTRRVKLVPRLTALVERFC
mmetsp:Transcript_42752/g.80109  ORF Transcript_42752/g.80109 Transcript_42752/m.80109 type:complete len:328 (-) Transcript_42752:143-1126(-)